jgi:hypothetical protein
MKTIIVCLGIIVTGCGGGMNMGTSPSFTGTWQFTGDSSVAALHFTGTGKLQQNGSSVTGNIDPLSGTPCATSAALNGTVSGTNLAFQINENGQITNLTGMINQQFTSASGTYAAPFGGCTNGDQGTWSGTKM